MPTPENEMTFISSASSIAACLRYETEQRYRALVIRVVEADGQNIGVKFAELIAILLMRGTSFAQFERDIESAAAITLTSTTSYKDVAIARAAAIQPPKPADEQ